jgi:1,4-dihydroxy-2-naphthoyl-CoA hydrolase
MADVERPATSDLTSFIRQQMPLCALLGVEGLEMDPASVRLALPWRADLCTAGGRLHGGALMALADSAGAACAFGNLPEGATGTSTIESKTNFFGGVGEGAAVATARPLHVGSTTIVVETEIRSDDGKLAAKVTQTQIVLRPRS